MISRPAGNVTFGDLVSSIPFRNDVGIITTKGSDIRAAFEASVRRYDKTVARGEFLQVSGKTYSVFGLFGSEGGKGRVFFFLYVAPVE